jgi:hypothetical protein
MKKSPKQKAVLEKKAEATTGKLRDSVSKPIKLQKVALSNELSLQRHLLTKHRSGLMVQAKSIRAPFQRTA